MFGILFFYQMINYIPAVSDVHAEYDIINFTIYFYNDCKTICLAIPPKNNEKFIAITTSR